MSEDSLLMNSELGLNFHFGFHYFPSAFFHCTAVVDGVRGGGRNPESGRIHTWPER
jgi:hypothetical protein